MNEDGSAREGAVAVEQTSVSRAGAGKLDAPGDDTTTPVQASASAEQLPVDSLKEAAPFLRRPFTAEAIKFKVQAGVRPGKDKPPTAGIVVAYIDARLVVERLNLVCPHLWEEPEYERIDERHLLCRLTIDGLTRADVGETSRGQDSGVGADPIKALYSDAFKRAAVKFGVGVSVYALPQVFLPVGEKGLDLKGGKLKLPDATLERLRGGYRTWLETKGLKFGEPLDHGDTLEPIAGEAFEDTDLDEPDEAGPVEGEEADVLRVRIKERFDQLRELDPQAMLPQEYGRRHAQADKSLEGLEALDKLLGEMLAERAGVAA